MHVVQMRDRNSNYEVDHEMPDTTTEPLGIMQ
jgi:hypothetical protein